MIFSIDIPSILKSLNDHAQPILAHGSIALFVLLALGIIALPIPEESLLVTAGFLVAKGKLFYLNTLLAAYLGTMCGISVSYLIGINIGSFLIKKYGRYLGFPQERIKRVESWFEKIGVWTLLIGYFIPGVRHLTGYVSGTLELPYFRFASFAYTGAILWASIFFSIGYYLGFAGLQH